jgi:hypothetical protein
MLSSTTLKPGTYTNVPSPSCNLFMWVERKRMLCSHIWMTCFFPGRIPHVHLLASIQGTLWRGQIVSKTHTRKNPKPRFLEGSIVEQNLGPLLSMQLKRPLEERKTNTGSRRVLYHLHISALWAEESNTVDESTYHCGASTRSDPTSLWVRIRSYSWWIR